MSLGFDNCYYACALGRKRVVVSNDVEASNPISTLLKRVCSETFTSNYESSSFLEALPFDILIKVLCGVDHDDLDQLFQVSKMVKEAAEIAEAVHFVYTTPKKRTFPYFQGPIGMEIKTPTAPLRKCRPRLISTKTMELLSTNLFPEFEEEKQEDK